MTATCRCGAAWGGLRTAHCTSCHRTFSGISAFDGHKPGRCRDPGACGMVVVRVSGNQEVWGHPGDGTWWKERSS
jgi:hypothetical protein